MMTTQVETLSGIAGLEWIADQGGRFCLPSGRSKKYLPDNWQNTPRSLADARKHAEDGGNVGLLTGGLSDSIVALDLDVDYPATVAVLGDLAHTAKVIRSNAPDRGKLLYRVDGALPPSRMYKINPTDKHPATELLSTGRHAVIPPSEFERGRYELVDADFGILTVSPATLARIWWLITGLDLYDGGTLCADADAIPHAARQNGNGNVVEQVKAAWTPATVFAHFGKTAQGTQNEKGKRGEETRVLGNGGLLVQDWRWYCHGDGVGGDAIDAWAWCKTGKLAPRQDGRGFMEIICDMAQAAGIPIPERGKEHAAGDGDDSDDSSGTGKGKTNQADLLYSLALEHCEIFTAQDGEAYAFAPFDGRRECYRLNTKDFRGWLTAAYRGAFGKMPGAQGQQDAIAALGWDARGVRRDVFVRTGAHNGRVYLDLGTAEWDAIEIDGNGWRLVERPPVAFRRPASFQELPLPMRGGTLADLRHFVNVEPDDWPLLAAWAMTALHPSGPYPVLVLAGEQGSAKSTTLGVLKRLIDPAAAGLRGQPQDVRDLFVGAKNQWLLAFDNVSHLTSETSDALCRLATGGGYAKRANYSDDGEFLVDAQRPVAINGIGDVVTRPDLMDRALLLVPPVIAEDRRRNESDFWREFGQARPRLLGALLDALSLALRRLPGTKLDHAPRMADFARVAVAGEPAYCHEGEFLTAYRLNREEAHATVIDTSTLGDHLRKLVLVNGIWEGTAAELLEALNQRATDNEQRSRSWPGAPNKVRPALQRLSPSLRQVGVGVEFLPRQKDGRRLRLVRLNG